MWNPPGSGIKPMSLALASGFFTAEQGSPDSPVLYGKFWEAPLPVSTGPVFSGLLWGKLRGLEFSSLLPAARLEGITDTLTFSCTTSLCPCTPSWHPHWLGGLDGNGGE